MTGDNSTDSGSSSRLSPSRRQFLRWLAYGTAGTGVAGWVGFAAISGDGSAPAGRVTRRSGQRTLVVIELGGGNDAWSTVVPADHGRYHDLRPTLALDEDELIAWRAGWALNRRLSGWQDRGLGVLAGVGTLEPDLSHFEMLNRWHTGDSRPSAKKATTEATGFLGRCCDAVGTPGQLTGISLAWGDHPSMISASSATTGLAAGWTNPLTDAAAGEEFRRTLQSVTGSTPDPSLVDASESVRGTLRVLDLISGLPPVTANYPDSDLGTQMALASRLVAGAPGIRVVHVPMGAATFDTHSKHRGTHADLMVELNDAVCAFLDDGRSSGWGDDVLVATVSEFGRRPAENTGGLDHGAASIMMLGGPIVAGLHGDPSPVDRFDPNDNLVATVDFVRYLATLGSWLGADPAISFPSGAAGIDVSPIPGLLLD